MASSHVEMSMSNAMRHATLTVRMTGMRRFRVRMWVAMQLVRLAAFVMNCGIAFDVTQGSD